MPPRPAPIRARPGLTRCIACACTRTYTCHPYTCNPRVTVLAASFGSHMVLQHDKPCLYGKVHPGAHVKATCTVSTACTLQTVASPQTAHGARVSLQWRQTGLTWCPQLPPTVGMLGGRCLSRQGTCPRHSTASSSATSGSLPGNQTWLVHFLSEAHSTGLCPFQCTWYHVPVKSTRACANRNGMRLSVAS